MHRHPYLNQKVNHVLAILTAEFQWLAAKISAYNPDMWQKPANTWAVGLLPERPQVVSRT
jgi:hypothetical protein